MGDGALLGTVRRIDSIKTTRSIAEHGDTYGAIAGIGLKPTKSRKNKGQKDAQV